jgi:hypothetical protein
MSARLKPSNKQLEAREGVRAIYESYASRATRLRKVLFQDTFGDGGPRSVTPVAHIVSLGNLMHLDHLVAQLSWVTRLRFRFSINVKLQIPPHPSHGKPGQAG